MVDKNALNAEDLEKVSGGYASAKHLPKDHGEHIPADKAKDHINEDVYFVRDAFPQYRGYGTIIKSEHSDEAGCIVHTIYVKEYLGFAIKYIFIGANSDLKSEDWTLFKKY